MGSIVVYIGGSPELCGRLLRPLAERRLSLQRRSGVPGTGFRWEDVDALLVDIEPPLGQAICRSARRASRGRWPILLLCRSCSAKELLAGFRAGADDCVALPEDPRVIAARLSAVLRRYQPKPDPRLIQVRGLKLDSTFHRATLDGRPLDLTRREFLILQRLASGGGRLLRRRDFLDRAKILEGGVLSPSLNVHVCNLRRKLRRGGRDLIETVRHVGYRLRI